MDAFNLKGSIHQNFTKRATVLLFW